MVERIAAIDTGSDLTEGVMPETVPVAPPAEPDVEPQTPAPAQPTRQPDLDPFAPDWPDGRPEPAPKA